MLPKNNLVLQMFCISLEELESCCSMSVSNLGYLFLWVKTKPKKLYIQPYILNVKMLRVTVLLCLITGHKTATKNLGWNSQHLRKARVNGLCKLAWARVGQMGGMHFPTPREWGKGQDHCIPSVLDFVATGTTKSCSHCIWPPSIFKRLYADQHGGMGMVPSSAAHDPLMKGNIGGSAGSLPSIVSMHTVDFILKAMTPTSGSKDTYSLPM